MIMIIDDEEDDEDHIDDENHDNERECNARYSHLFPIAHGWPKVEDRPW